MFFTGSDPRQAADAAACSSRCGVRGAGHVTGGDKKGGEVTVSQDQSVETLMMIDGLGALGETPPPWPLPPPASGS